MKKLTLNVAMRRAEKLLKRLQDRIDKDPSKFCENYGQKEIMKFEDKLSDLHYTDRAKVIMFLQQVADMVPRSQKN